MVALPRTCGTCGAKLMHYGRCNCTDPRDDLEYVQMNVASHMEKIVKLFKPGVKIAVLVRTPDFPDRDFMMTDDDLFELYRMLIRRAAAQGTDIQKAGD